jgi:hypothetical protein
LKIEDKTNSSVILEKDRNCPISEVLLIKSAFSNLFHRAFNFDVGNLVVIPTWITSWKNTNIIKRERFVNTWDVCLLLYYLKTVKINLEEDIMLEKDYRILLNKTIASVAFFN